ncbi:11654_t:CDS:2, partial [Dentiscutata erythropus]
SRNSETGFNIFSIGENEPQEYSETNESKRGRPDDMHMHLARQCLNVSDEIKYFWRDFIAEEKTSIRKKTKHNQSDITIHFSKVEPLSETR